MEGKGVHAQRELRHQRLLQTGSNRCSLNNRPGWIMSGGPPGLWESQHGRRCVGIDDEPLSEPVVLGLQQGWRLRQQTLLPPRGRQTQQLG